LDGAYLFSGLRLLEGTVVLVLNGTTLFPSKNSLSFDIVSLQVLDVIGLTDGLNQSAHLVGELGNEDHGLEMRRDGAFGCCHSCKPNEDGVDCKGRVGVPGNDDVHCHLKFFIGGGDSGFTVGSFEVLPGYGSEHRVDLGVLLDGFFEEVQNSCGECWMEAKHDVPQSPIIGIEPRVNFRLVLGGFGGIWGCFGMSSFHIGFGDCGYGLVVRSGELVCDDLPLTLGEKIVHHQRPPGLPVQGAV